MTKKDYELIALTLKAAIPLDPSFMPMWNAIVLDFADSLRCTNPAFNKAKFTKACGMED